jgi:hypothetical protein
MGKEHCNESYKLVKMQSYQVRASTYLRGEIKNKFLNECVIRGGNEAVALREIIIFHFQILDKLGIDKGADYSDVLKMVTKHKY